MEEMFFEVLKETGYPYMLQGSLLPEETYPDNFFTFWNNSSSDGGHYDNKAASVVYDWDLNFYSIDPEKVYTVLEETIQKLKEKGFIVSGVGYSVASDEPTHDGRGVNVLYRKEIGGKQK